MILISINNKFWNRNADVSFISTSLFMYQMYQTHMITYVHILAGFNIYGKLSHWIIRCILISLYKHSPSKYNVIQIEKFKAENCVRNKTAGILHATTWYIKWFKKWYIVDFFYHWYECINIMRILSLHMTNISLD